jgi:hypothetical protein
VAVSTRAAPRQHAGCAAPFAGGLWRLEYATALGVDVTSPTSVKATLPEPEDWPTFFKRIADRSVPGVFAKLVRGPNPRGQQRIDRVLRDGRVTDIYGAILYAISTIPSRSTISPSEITRILETNLVQNPPARQQVVASLGHMRDIAREARGAGDPALDYKNDEVHMLDPFLSFYLRYGSWALPRDQQT